MGEGQALGDTIAGVGDKTGDKADVEGGYTWEGLQRRFSGAGGERRKEPKQKGVAHKTRQCGTTQHHTCNKWTNVDAYTCCLCGIHLERLTRGTLSGTCMTDCVSKSRRK